MSSDWQTLTHRQRCRAVGRVRHSIVEIAELLVEYCRNDQRTDPVETLTAELTPLCEALRFIGKRGPSILRNRKAGLRGRPIWLWGVRSEVQRVPLGDVLVLAAWNYPLFLPGVQIAQALAAGNRVWLKPAPGCEVVTAHLVTAFLMAGIPSDALRLLPPDPMAAQQRIDAGVDLVVLTGGTKTGRSVMTRCAQTLTPSIMELSGCDAVVIGPGADLERVADCVAFGLSFNGGATCIGPRRIIVSPSGHGPLVAALAKRLADLPAVKLHRSARDAAQNAVAEALRRGAVDIARPGRQPPGTNEAEMFATVLDGVGGDWGIANADLFAPVASIITAETEGDAIGWVNRCPYRLAASVFAEPAWARRVAEKLNVGHVSINDLIFPTADPRVPFGGCGSSGFGVTRGAEGLLAMTRPKVVARHRGGLYLHLQKRKASDYGTLLGWLRFSHRRYWWN